MPQKDLFTDVTKSKAAETKDEEKITPVPLHELANGQEADFFALLSDKSQLTTKDGKPYWRVTFRDAKRECSFPVWSDAPHFKAATDEWQVGGFYKVRALYHETAYGPQFDIRRIRAVEKSDEQDGFDPAMCQRRSAFDLQEMFDELLKLAKDKITDDPLQTLVVGLLEKHQEELLVWPAAVRNHHAFVGGYLEHVRNVANHAVQLAENYALLYPDMNPALDVGMVAAGGILHDIGKLLELRTSAVGAEYTASGSLVGHILQGRDMVRDAARELDPPLDTESLLRLEHIIISHQRLPEWGSPKPPMTPEALIVHFADDCDAKFMMMKTVIEEADGETSVTNRRNVLNQQVYRGGE